MKLSAAQVRALDKFCQPGGHGFGKYAYLSRATANALSDRGLVTLTTRNLSNGRRLPWVSSLSKDATRFERLGSTVSCRGAGRKNKT